MGFAWVALQGGKVLDFSEKFNFKNLIETHAQRKDKIKR